jgi:predicted acyltransferase
VAGIALWGVILIVIGLLWGLDLSFNKPRWTPAYLLYTSGVGAVTLAALYAVIDLHRIRQWAYPLVVFGANAIAVYWVSIMAKVLLLNTPRISEANHRLATVLKYATLASVTVVLGIVLFKLVRWCVGQIGPAAYMLLLPAIALVAILWTRSSVLAVPHAQNQSAQSIGNVVLSTLKTSAGPWAGGWLFTLTFVALWWLILDTMYRRKIFWKL